MSLIMVLPCVCHEPVRSPQSVIARLDRAI
jgi:hypothetical protein